MNTYTGYVCPDCGQPGYLHCTHMQDRENIAYIVRQKAIALAYRDLHASHDLYIAMTGNNPHRIPSTGNDN